MVELSEGEKETIGKHRYVHIGVPLFEPILRVYWKFIQRHFTPRNLGPNVITVIGLLINIVTCVVVWYFSCDSKQEVPTWALWITGIGVFLYQTCDGVDGLHETSLGANECLGEYFDHVCDALTTAFLSVRLCIAVGIGTHPLLGLALGLCASVAFYLTHWNSFTTGVVEFELMDNGEGQDLIMLACALAAIYGTNAFSLKDPVFGIEYKVLVVGLAVSGVVVHCIKKLRVLRTHSATVANTSPTVALLPLLFALASALIIFMNSTRGVFVNHFALYVCLYGSVMAKLINNLLICKIAKKTLPLIDRTYLGPVTLLANQLTGYAIDEFNVLILAFLYCAGDHLYETYSFGCDICDVWDAPFFRVPSLHVSGKKRT